MKEKLDKLEKSGKKAFESVKKDLEAFWEDTKKGIKTLRNELK